MHFAFPLLRGVIVPQCIKKGPKNQMEFEILRSNETISSVYSRFDKPCPKGTVHPSRASGRTANCDTASRKRKNLSVFALASEYRVIPQSTFHLLLQDLPQRVSIVQNILEVMEGLKLGVKPVILRWSGGCIGQG